MACVFPYTLTTAAFMHVHRRTVSTGPDQPRIGGKPGARGPIYKISYDLSYDYRKFIVRSTYDSDLKHAEISLGNIVS